MRGAVLLLERNRMPACRRKRDNHNCCRWDNNDVNDNSCRGDNINVNHNCCRWDNNDNHAPAS